MEHRFLAGLQKAKNAYFNDSHSVSMFNFRKEPEILNDCKDKEYDITDKFQWGYEAAKVFETQTY